MLVDRFGGGGGGWPILGLNRSSALDRFLVSAVLFADGMKLVGFVRVFGAIETFF